MSGKRKVYSRQCHSRGGVPILLPIVSIRRTVRNNPRTSGKLIYDEEEQNPLMRRKHFG